MGNYKCRRPGFLSAWQINAAELMFQGRDDEYIALHVFNLDQDSPDYQRKLKNARGRLTTLRRNEKFQEYYKSIITEWSVHNVGKALTTIARQMDDPNPWMANKAANDILIQSKKFTGNDENTVTIQFENPIELGTPDDSAESTKS